MFVSLRRVTTLLMVCLSLGACALFNPRDPLTVQVAGLAPAPGDDLELRLLIKLRVQNPNPDPIPYAGVALKVTVNGQPLASGVSPAQGTVAGYGEVLISIPVTVSAFSVMRQAFGLSTLHAGQRVTYQVEGKLDGPWIVGAVRFSDEGQLDPSVLTAPGG